MVDDAPVEYRHGRSVREWIDLVMLAVGILDQYSALRRVELEILLQDGLDGRRRGAAAVAGVLDNAGDRDARMVERGESDEPAVIAVLFRYRVLLGAFALGLFDDLRGAGLAGHDHIIHLGPVRRAIRLIDHARHPGANEVEDLRIDPHFVLNDGRKHLDRAAVERVDLLDELRLVERATVGDRRRHIGQLQRGGADVALADRRGKGLGRIPALTKALLLPLTRRDHARPFVVELNSALFAQTQGVRPDRQPVDPEMLADVVKEDVAGFHDCAMERDRAVPLFAPAAVFAATEVDPAGARVSGLRSQGAVLQGGDRVHNFEGRAGWVDALDDAVRQRMLGIGGQRTPER